jgi:hypothetical protein
MNTEIKFTEQKIQFANKKVFGIYSRMTTKGIRFYYWASGRFLPISKSDINTYILLD